MNEELRERVAQAIWVADEGPARADEWWDRGEHQAHVDACYKRADAVLDALGLEQVGWWHDEFGFEVTKHGIAGPENSGEPVYRLRGDE